MATQPSSDRSAQFPILIFCLSLLSGALALAQEPAISPGAQFQIVPLPRTAGSPTNLPPDWAGPRRVHGVPFELGSPLCLTGMEDARQGAFYPSRSGPVGLGRKVARFHFLVAANAPERDGVPLASLAMHYASGDRGTTRLVYGAHVRSRVPGRDEERMGRADPLLALQSIVPGQYRVSLTNRLYQVAFDNPHPDQPVESVEWISLFSRTAVCVLAMTSETGDVVAAPQVPTRSRSRLERRAAELDDETYHRVLEIEANDAQTGSPVTPATATLTIADADGTFFFGRGQADAAGVIRLSFPPHQMMSLTAVIRAPGRRPFVYTSPKWAASSIPERISARLEAGVRAGGIVQDESGLPISNVVIRISHLRQVSSREYTRLDYEPVATDAAGQWASSELPASLAGFQFQVVHPDFRPIVATASAGPAERGSLAIDPEAVAGGRSVIRLQSGLRLAGVVRNATGQPVANSTVRAQAARLADSGAANEATTVTRATGEFAISVFEPGPHFVLVTGSNQVPWMQLVNVQEGTNRAIEVTLAAPRTMRGLVTDREQQPIPRARIRLHSWNEMRLLAFETETDDRGTFVWENPPPGNLRILVSAVDCYSFEEAISGELEQYRCTLEKTPYAYVVGSAVDADTKQPIESFSISHLWTYPSEEPSRWRRYKDYGGARGRYSARMRVYSQERNVLLVSAPGYLPVKSEPFTGSGPRTNHFELHKDPGIRGLVLDDSGNPVSGAMVAAVDANEQMYIHRTGGLYRSEGGPAVRSDRTGRFELPPKLEPHTILASHARGFAQVKYTNFLATGRISLQSWARVEVIDKVGTTIPDRAPELRLADTSYRSSDSSRESEPLSVSLLAEPEPNGLIVFPRVPPGERRLVLGYMVRTRNYSRSMTSHSFPMTLLPGETRSVTFGEGGREIIGRVSIEGGDPEDVDWTRDFHVLELVREPRRTFAASVDVSSPMKVEERKALLAEQRRRENEYQRSPEGRAYERGARTYVLEFQTNGAFRAKGVLPGTYRLSISPTDPSRETSSSQPIGNLTQQVVVPEPTRSETNPPVDLGTLPLKIRPTLRVGKRAPAFETVDFAGKKITLGDFKGKPVLIHFWATGSTAEFQHLKALDETYGHDKRLALLSVNFDPSQEIAKATIDPLAPAWRQAYAGGWGENNSIQWSFGLRGLPEVMLVDADGQVVAMNLRGPAILRAVERALAAVVSK